MIVVQGPKMNRDWNLYLSRRHETDFSSPGTLFSWGQTLIKSFVQAAWRPERASAPFCASANTSRADVVPATCSVPRSEVHPSRVHALKHFFGRSSVALRDAELLERFAHPARGTAKAFTSRFRTSPNCSATSSALTIEPSSMTRCPDHAGPVRSFAASAPMSFVATIVDFRFVGL